MGSSSSSPLFSQLGGKGKKVTFASSSGQQQYGQPMQLSNEIQSPSQTPPYANTINQGDNDIRNLIGMRSSGMAKPEFGMMPTGQPAQEYQSMLGISSGKSGGSNMPRVEPAVMPQVQPSQQYQATPQPMASQIGSPKSGQIGMSQGKGKGA